jgi:hypothetical protein
MKALSACVAIGMTILGCGSSSGGGGSDDASGTCGKVAACGGDLVGTWKVAAACANITSMPSNSQCPNESVQGASVTASGTSTFNSDLTFSLDLTESVSETLVVPMSCLTAGGTTVTCDDLSSTLGAALGDGGVMTSCTTSGSNCNCTIGLAGQSTHETGTYSVSGNSFSTIVGGTTSTTDFCVQGNQLHVVTASMADMEGVSTDIVGIKQ